MEWGEYKLGELFEINSSKKRFDANKVEVLDNGKFPYIVRMGSNNGQKGFINEDENFLNKGNTISFGQDTVTMFYQEKPYFTGDKIKILKSRDKRFNKQNSQFFILAMSKAFSSFSWGASSFEVKIIESQKIQLPTKNGKIDFDFMEEFIAELEAERIAELEAYLLATGLKDYTLTEEEQKALEQFESDNFDWGEFRIEKLFKIRKGKRLPERVLVDTIGSIALINQSTQNNMVSRYSGFQELNEIYKKNAITFGVNTKSFGYQTNDFYTIADVLFFKSNFLNDKIASYFITIIKKQLPPDGWDKIFGLSQMKDLFIKLPIQNNKPDYKFMESFISAIQKLVIKDVVLYTDRKIEASNGVVSKQEF